MKIIFQTVIGTCTRRQPQSNGLVTHGEPIYITQEQDIPNNPPTDPPTSQGIDEVFSLFKTYLENRLERKGKEIEEKQKIDLQAEKFKFKSNQKQFVFNAELEELVGKIKEANAQKLTTRRWLT